MTQLQYALEGKITPEMLEVAKKENVDPEWLRQEIARGRIVIPKNINHNFSPEGVGYGLRTKVNANIGTSPDRINPEQELKKLDIAVKYGAHSVMDLSTGGRLNFIRLQILRHSPVMVGTVPIYAVATQLGADGLEFHKMDPEMLFKEIERQARQGVDFMTIHAGITRTTVHFEEGSERVGGIVSRGGSLLKKWMFENNAENPLYEHFDRVLDICEQYDVTISLGDAVRPGAWMDATDRGQIAELLVLGELVDKARKRGVQVMVEGPGHVPLDQIEMNVKLMKRVTNEAPFYVLGPLTTDAAAGYDHIVSAIGGAIAASAGADFLCYVTPAEHLTLPNEEDVKLGVIASVIAAHSADIVKNVGGARERDLAMSKARRDLNWEEMFKHALFPDDARDRREASESSDEEYCTMCGPLCAVRTDSSIKKILEVEPLLKK